MLNRFKNAVSSVMGGVSSLSQLELEDSAESSPAVQSRLKFPYNRPEFLHLSTEEVLVSADHIARPILVPRDITNLPWSAGYAEVINAGKTKLNEDQARAQRFYVGPNKKKSFTISRKSPSSTISPPHRKQEHDHVLPGQNTQIEDEFPCVYFGLFDGHAGTGASLMAVKFLHLHIQEKLQEIHDLLVAKTCKTGNISNPVISEYANNTPLDDLVIGALEQAFCDMDKQIEKEKRRYRITGGCTALVAIFFLNKLYVANAGDCRAILLRGNDHVIPMSTDFTPHTERERVQFVAATKPELLGNEFSHLEYPKRITRKDIGKKTLYRDALMRGWACKVIKEEDTKFPLVYGEGKRARMLATIGVTRGFGDHDLTVSSSNIYIKPFLSPMPEVQVYDMKSYHHKENDVLVMASDGLWDVTTNELAQQIVAKSLSQFEAHEISRYASAAQDLAMHARGLLKKGWRTKEDKPASGDDITVFVIPLNK